MKALLAQTRSELMLSLRNGEQLLVNVAIPLLLLVFFSAVEVLPIPTGVDKRVDFLAPGIIALAWAHFWNADGDPAWWTCAGAQPALGG